MLAHSAMTVHDIDAQAHAIDCRGQNFRDALAPKASRQRGLSRRGSPWLMIHADCVRQMPDAASAFQDKATIPDVGDMNR